MPHARQLVHSVSVLAVVAALGVPSASAQVADSFRIGAISLSYVTRNTKLGKAEIAKIDEAGRRKVAELETKAAEIQKQEAELQKTGAAMSARARADLQRAFEKSRVELERFQQDAQAEIWAMQTQFDADFRARLEPVIAEVSKEKGLQFVFGLEQAAIIWSSPAVDISEDVVKRLDAGK